MSLSSELQQWHIDADRRKNVTFSGFFYFGEIGAIMLAFSGGELVFTYENDRCGDVQDGASSHACSRWVMGAICR